MERRAGTVCNKVAPARTLNLLLSFKSKSTPVCPDLLYTEDDIDFAINVIENVRPWRHFPGMSLKLPSEKQSKPCYCCNFRTNL